MRNENIIKNIIANIGNILEEQATLLNDLQKDIANTKSSLEVVKEIVNKETKNENTKAIKSK